MGLDDFEVLQPLGKGAFARVDKVRRSGSVGPYGAPPDGDTGNIALAICPGGRLHMDAFRLGCYPGRAPLTGATDPFLPGTHTHRSSERRMGRCTP